MLNTINHIRLDGNVGREPKIIETEKSTFVELSVATKRPVAGEDTDKVKFITEWHKVMIFDEEDIQFFKGFDITKGSKVRVEGTLSYRNRPIKDADGEVITTVKEAFVVAYRVLPV